jgi:hypothetical protein
MGFGKAVRLLLASVVVSALPLTPSVPAGLARHLPCPRKGAEVTASDKLVRVYSYPPTKERYPPPRRTEACVIGRGTRMTLFDPGRPHEGGLHLRFAGVIALSGPIVAYSVGYHLTDTGGSDVSVADIAARRILRTLPGGGSVDAGLLGQTTMTDFVLDPSGSAAWIDEKVGPISGRTRTFIVRAAPLGREDNVLDEGPAIVPRSLELVAGTLSWLDAGTPRTARLTP